MGIFGQVGKAAATIGAIRNAAYSPSVGLASRLTDKLDVKIVREDGAVVTAGVAAWRQGLAIWRPLAKGRSTPGAPFTAVSRSADRLDIFMVGLDGRVYYDETLDAIRLAMV
jgi:hypothetical protein